MEASIQFTANTNATCEQKALIPHVLDDSDRSQTSNATSITIQRFMIEEGYVVDVSLANLSDEDVWY